MKKRLLSMILVVMFLLSLIPAYAADAGYGDMDGHWAKDAVEAVSQMGLVQGYDGKFNPDAQISRGEMAVILDRMMNYLTAGENTFTDLDENYYTEAVLNANAAGVIQGANGLVRPKDPITRQEAMVMLSRAMGLDGEGDLSVFADGEAVADWAKAAVSAMVGKGYIQGNAGQLRPTDTITRAETVTILQRMVGALVDEGGTLTGKVTGTVVVRGADTKLEDLEIEGDLIIAEGVGEGNVELKNVTISGNTIVRGGGEHSIIMANVRVGGGIVVSKREGRVRIVTSGNTTVSVTVLESGAILVGDGFETVEISAELAEGQTIELEGKFERLVNNSENASIKASGEIKTVEANAETDIEGKNLKINKTEGEAAVKQNGKDVAASGSTGSSGGGGSSGGSSSRVDSSISAATMNDARKVEGAVADVDYVANANTFTVSAIKTSESLEVAGEEGKTETVSVPVSQVTVSGTLKEISYYRADLGDTAEDAVTGYWYGVKVQSPYAEADHVLYGGGDTLAKNYAFTPGDGGWAEPHALESGSLTIALQTPDAYPAIWAEGGARYFAIAWMKKVADDPAGEMESWNAGNYEVLGYSYITINPDGLKKAANVEAVTLSKNGDDKVKLSYQRNTIGSAAEVKFFAADDSESGIFTLSGDATDGGKLGKVELEYTVTVPEEAADYYASVGGVKSAKVTLDGSGDSGDSGDSGNGGSDSENSGTVKLNKSTLTLVENGTEKLTAEVTPAEATVTWSSSDTSVATVDTEGNVTAVAKGTATIKATITVNGQNYSASCTVTVKKLGWDTEESEKYAVDARFAEGYPVCSFDDENGLKLKVKIPSASAENPVEVFVVVNNINPGWDADATAILHGHVGEGEQCVDVSDAPYYRIEDGDEHVFEVDTHINWGEDVDVYFVLKDSTGTSEKPTRIVFGAEILNELDTRAPYIGEGYLNQARDKIYFHVYDKGFDMESVPAASAFTLEGVSDAAVTGVTFGSAEGSNYYKTYYHYICLAVTGIDADTDISELKVTYTKPRENPIQDTASTPNQTKGFTVQVVVPAAMEIPSENVYFSSDGKYLHVETTTVFYYAMGGGFEKTATVTVNGSSLTYTNTMGTRYGDGVEMGFYCEDANLTVGDEAQVTLTLKEGTVNDAMDAMSSTVTGTGTIPAATTDLKIVSAEYGKFSQIGGGEKVLKITFNTENGDWGDGCSFQLSDGTNTYVLRGHLIGTLKDKMTYYVDREDGRLWVTPEAGWTLTYKPLHKDEDCLMKELSGKPMAEQTIAITIVDDSAE